MIPIIILFRYKLQQLKVWCDDINQNHVAAVRLNARKRNIESFLPVFFTIKPPAKSDNAATDVPKIPDIKPICLTLYPRSTRYGFRSVSIPIMPE